MKLILVVAAVVAAGCLQCDAKTFTICGLVRELRKQNFPASQLRDLLIIFHRLVCLVQKESRMRTDIIGPPNSDGSRDHGLYQINDRYWCNTSNTPGKDCNVTCAQLRTDDITRASTCAKKVYQRHGFSAWYGYMDHCRSPGALPDISNC